jgi:hypothetical protein
VINALRRNCKLLILLLLVFLPEQSAFGIIVAVMRTSEGILFIMDTNQRSDSHGKPTRLIEGCPLYIRGKVVELQTEETVVGGIVGSLDHRFDIGAAANLAIREGLDVDQNKQAVITSIEAETVQTMNFLDAVGVDKDHYSHSIKQQIAIVQSDKLGIRVRAFSIGIIDWDKRLFEVKEINFDNSDPNAVLVLGAGNPILSQNLRIRGDAADINVLTGMMDLIGKSAPYVSPPYSVAKLTQNGLQWLTAPGACKNHDH